MKKKNIIAILFIISTLTYAKENNKMLVFEFENTIVEEPSLGIESSQLIINELSQTPNLEIMHKSKKEILSQYSNANLKNTKINSYIGNNLAYDYILMGSVNSSDMFIKKLSIVVIELKTSKTIITSKIEFENINQLKNSLKTFYNDFEKKFRPKKNKPLYFLGISFFNTQLDTMEQDYSQFIGTEIILSSLLYKFIGIRGSLGVGVTFKEPFIQLRLGPYFKVNNRFHLYADVGTFSLDPTYYFNPFLIYGIGSNLFISDSLAQNIELSGTFIENTVVAQMSLGLTLAIN